MLNIRQKTWSPYTSGALLGLLQLPLYLLLNKTLSAGSGYFVISDTMLSLININFGQIEPGFTTMWSVAFLIGIMLGAFISARLANNKRLAIAAFWQQEPLNYSKIKRFTFAFIGGYFLMLGARFVADGAGFDGFSGIAKLQFSSFLAFICMFITAILIVRLQYRA